MLARVRRLVQVSYDYECRSCGSASGCVAPGVGSATAFSAGRALRVAEARAENDARSVAELARCPRCSRRPSRAIAANLAVIAIASLPIGVWMLVAHFVLSDASRPMKFIPTIALTLFALAVAYLPFRRLTFANVVEFVERGKHHGRNVGAAMRLGFGWLYVAFLLGIVGAGVLSTWRLDSRRWVVESEIDWAVVGIGAVLLVGSAAAYAMARRQTAQRAT